ncbi:MAG: 30S ribosomal protein S2 [Kiritimatiellae bacterium]|jgi:small subunit ribosomal protein S2|nr:30S ribosomal protein S2 [Kiritimatiellia bacterium]
MDSNVNLPSTGLQELLDAGVHFGHQTKRWNPYMSKYIFGERKGIYVIDLGKSLVSLRIAQKFVYDTAVRGRQLLFVGTKKQAQDIVKETAQKLHQPFVVHRWLGGMLTNNQTIQGSITRMKELEAIEERGEMDAVAGSKKEASRMRRELVKLQRNLEGMANMPKLPAALVIVDVVRESIAVQEARRLGIPVVAIVDTNADPRIIDYPIPGNDDSIRSIGCIMDLLGETIQHASNEYARVAAEESRKRAAAEAEQAEKRKQAEAERKVRQDEEKKKRDAVIKAAAAKLAEENAKKAAEAPKEEAPKEEAPKAEAPKEEAPKSEKVETPAEAPVAETPTAEEPAPAEKTEAPTAEADAPAEEAAAEESPEAEKAKSEG